MDNPTLSTPCHTKENDTWYSLHVYTIGGF